MFGSDIKATAAPKRNRRRTEIRRRRTDRQEQRSNHTKEPLKKQHSTICAPPFSKNPKKLQKVQKKYTNHPQNPSTFRQKSKEIQKNPTFFRKLAHLARNQNPPQIPPNQRSYKNLQPFL